MPTVKFNSVGEFCDELRRDADKVDRHIVRATNRWELSKLSPNIQHLCVVASYSVDGQVVRLERYYGDVWGINQEADDKILEKAKETHALLSKVCEELALDLRAGNLEESRLP